MRRILALLLLLSSGSLLAQAKPKIVCWNDDQGVRHCGDRVPPEYAKTDRERLDAQGRVISTQARELTAEELAEKKRAEEAAALEAQRRKEAEAYDRFLLQSFTLPEDILSARDERLRILDGRIRLADEG
ncbi:MAG TPA: hypothetical protein VFV27_09970, partial [Nevskiaceae bacterium]|nr:hypothetical protein [Nevskiaceae bacterium]